MFHTLSRESKISLVAPEWLRSTCFTPSMLSLNNTSQDHREGNIEVARILKKEEHRGIKRHIIGYFKIQHKRQGLDLPEGQYEVLLARDWHKAVEHVTLEEVLQDFGGRHAWGGG